MSLSNLIPPATPNPPPFSPTITYPDGDVILKSSDGHDFCVHKMLLRLASPLFAEMFSLPLPPTTTSAQIKAIPMDEDGATLEQILTCIYPLAANPFVISIEHGVLLLHAAEKLQVERATALIGNRLQVHFTAQSNPLRAWAIASRFGMTEARKAAKLRFIAAEDDFQDSVVAELRFVQADEYHELLVVKRSKKIHNRYRPL